MGTPFYSVDVIYVGVDIFTEARIVLHCNFNRNPGFVGFQVNGLIGELIPCAIEEFDEFQKTKFGIESLRPGPTILFHIIGFPVVGKGKLNPLVQECKFP
ncbi:hypothetical protein SDC9_144817 [bioreactor metagenome]|uniref:Uncharacterized protein n=1 Tax=bioreactor metagenome TaxID=1076179 RepID=A0A645EAJ6_9ZZZZ